MFTKNFNNAHQLYTLYCNILLNLKSGTPVSLSMLGVKNTNSINTKVLAFCLYFYETKYTYIYSIYSLLKVIVILKTIDAIIFKKKVLIK